MRYRTLSNPERAKYDVKLGRARNDSRQVDSSPPGLTGRGLVQALRNIVWGEDPLQPSAAQDLRRLAEAGLLVRRTGTNGTLNGTYILTELGWQWCEQLGISLPLEPVSRTTQPPDAERPTEANRQAA